MEITQENINSLANSLREGKFNMAMKSFQELTEIAKDLMEKYPEADIDELCEIFDREQEELQNKGHIQEDQKSTENVEDQKDNDFEDKEERE